MPPGNPSFLALAACLAAAAVVDSSSLDGEALLSKGCSGARLPHGQDSLVKYEIEVADFEPVTRVFWVQLPPAQSAVAAGPAPLLLSFHGQEGLAENFAQQHAFSTLGAGYGLISVFPQGMRDVSGEDDQGTGWNVGSAGEDGNATCLLQGVGKKGGCYESCRKLGKCGRCNWSTCYNDVLFVETLLAKVAAETCIDLNRIYLHGASNGGMMVTHLVRQLPETFAGVVPCFGTPMLGFLLGPEMQLLTRQAAVTKTALLTLHARSDVTIPPGGGVSTDGWIYESEHSVRALWAALHGCQRERSRLPTPWDGGTLNFSCYEHLACSSGRRVIGCRYDGKHGDWPAAAHGDEITLWFLLQFSRAQPGRGTEQLI